VKAAVLERFSEPLAVREVPAPRPAEGEALVRVRATGICGTDLKITSGSFGSALPLIPGHEVAGDVVEADGSSSVGERVACYIYETCGRCRWCRSGRTTLCPGRVRLGFERDGGLAEYVAVREENLLRLPAPVSYAGAAIAMDAIAVPWMALHRRARIEAGQSVVVAGAGGLGMHAIQIARAAGCSVAAVDPLPAHLARARELGAELTVPPEEADRIAAWADDGVDVALETSGARGGFDAAARCVRRGGRIVCCGYHPGVEYGLDSRRLVLEEIEILGSVNASIDAARAALDAIADASVEPQIADRESLDGANSALARLAAGDVLGRVVVEA